MSRRRRRIRWLIGGLLVLPLLLGLERGLDLVAPYPVDRLVPYASSLILVDAAGTELRWADRDGERRFWVDLDAISPFVLQALIAGEDRRFRAHTGVDGLAVGRAALANLLHGRRISGASTLTMQVARLVDPAQRTWVAKLREALRARQLERRLDKDAILEQYCNRAPWGGRLRGIEAASRHWFGTAAADLGPAQAAMLVAMLPAPSARSPLRHPDLVRDRRDRILAAMPLDAAALARALAEPLPTAAHPFPWLAPHACDAALAKGALPGEDGRIHLDLRLADQDRVRVALAALAPPMDGAAIVVVDRDGRERVHLGSSDWSSRPFDTARADRAAGSTLKPFLYRRAFADDRLGEQGLIADAPFVAAGWRPTNEDERFLGELPVGEALWRSRNPPAARALAAIGLEAFADELADQGLALPVRGLDAALGSAAVRPIELAQAYAALARRADAGDLPAQTVLSALAERPIAPELIADGDLAWKTGTSSHRRDAWCVAIDNDRIVAVWLGWQDGRTDPRLRGRDGARELCARTLLALRPWTMASRPEQRRVAERGRLSRRPE